MKYTAIFMLLSMASAAAAQTCTFTTECFEGDGCYDTEFSVTLEGGQLISDAETISVAPLPQSQTLLGLTPSAVHMLTRAEDGSTRYTTHIFDGPLLISYLGTCE